MNDRPALRQRIYLISGDVQGVGYRQFAKMIAKSNQIVGYVRNLPDGRVEVVAQGTSSSLNLFDARLREGPPFSEVDDAEYVESDPVEYWNAFEIR